VHGRIEDRRSIYGRTEPHPNAFGDPLVRYANRYPRRMTAFAILIAAPGIFFAYQSSQVKLYLDFRVYMMGASHLTDPRLYLDRTTYILHFPFTYPPPAALFFWPLSVLPFHVATFVWTTAMLISLAAIIRVVLRLARQDASSRGLWALTSLGVAGALYLEPISQNLHFGQVNLVLGAMTLYDVVDRPSRRLPRGLLLGVATAVKLVPGVFILFLLARRQYRAALVSALTVVILNVLTLMVNTHASMVYWRTDAINPRHMGGTVYNSNQSLRGALQRLLHHLVNHGLLTVVEVLMLVVGLYLAVAIASKRSELAAITAVGVTGDLVSPISWSHHLVWFLPLIVWLLLAHDRPRSGPWWAAALALACWFNVIWWPPDIHAEPLHWNWWQSLVGNTYFFAMALFLVALVVSRPGSVDDHTPSTASSGTITRYATRRPRGS